MWARRPIIHACTPQPLTIPLYNFHDWDAQLISQFYGRVCKCTGGTTIVGNSLNTGPLDHQMALQALIAAESMAAAPLVNQGALLIDKAVCLSHTVFCPKFVDATPGAPSL